MLDTRLALGDRQAFRSLGPKHGYYYSNCAATETAGGIFTLVSPYLRNNYDITQVDLPATAAGRVLALEFVSKATAKQRMPFYAAAVYLSPGAAEKERMEQLQALSCLHHGHHLFLYGDFNFVERPQDTTSESDYYSHSEEFTQFWNKFLRRRRLRELLHPVFTYTNNDAGSRLDRFYISHSEADATLFQPTVHTPMVPFLARPTRFNRRTQDSGNAPDHLALGLTFHRPGNKQGHANVPRWIASSPVFIKTVRDRWAVDDPLREQDPPPAGMERSRLAYERRSSFIATIRNTAKDYLRANTYQAYDDELTRLSYLVKLNRLASQVAPDRAHIARLLDRAPFLRDVLPNPNHKSCGERIRALINKLVGTYPTADQWDQASHATTHLGHGAHGQATPPEAAPHRPRDPSDDEFREPTDDHSCYDEPTLDDSPHRWQKRNQLTDFKRILPSDKRALTSISPTSTSEPVTDPAGMAKAIKDWWSKTWSRRAGAPADPFDTDILRSYGKTIPEASTPCLPSLEDVTSAIRTTNNSCAGPDGVPFAVYRHLCDIAAPVLLDVALALSRGDRPPKGYNLGRLFLIPKTTSPTVDQHRPISVTNADNRIVARVLARAITPALQSILHPNQKGFVPGRLGTEHILDLNEAYYRSTDPDDPYYILFVDVKKAFDSVDHNFILAVLRKAGFPEWVINSIAGLLHQAAVTPMVGRPVNCVIPVTRGVKQGCPLSPLLFALCYDPLIEAIGNLPQAGRDPLCAAYADDVAIGSSSLSYTLDCLRTMLEFGKISGLQLNFKKTVLLPSRPPTSCDHATVRTSGLPINFVTREKYLGILMGHDITTVDIFAAPLRKFLDRLAKYRPVLQSMPYRHRVRIYNVFLLPLFSYHCQFYLMPDKEVASVALAAARRAVIPFGGTAWSYTHSIAEKHDLGFSAKMEDLWAYSYSLLAAQLDLKSQHGCKEPSFPLSNVVNQPDWGSLRIREHITFAANLVLSDYAPRLPNGALDTTFLAALDADLPPCSTERKHITRGWRRQLRRIMITGYWHKSRFGNATKSGINYPSKLLKLGLDTAEARRAAGRSLDNYRRIPSGYLPHVRDTYLRFVYNALPTPCRLRSAGLAVADSGDSSRYTCPLCDGHSYTIAHLLRCDGTEIAWGICLSHLRLRTSISAHHGLLLNYEYSETTPPPTLAITFAWALWNTLRWDYHADRDALLNAIGTKAATVFDATVKRAKLRKVAAAKRKRDTQAQAAIDFDALANTFHCSDLVIYTDGSASPNPGPCGAGLFCRVATPAGPRTLDLHTALGPGSNNLGEGWAIGMALQLANRLITTGTWIGSTVRICTDSNLWLGLLTCGHRPSQHTFLYKAVTALLTTVNATVPVLMHKAPAHVDIFGNEKADDAAKRGAADSGNDRNIPLASLKALAADHHFITLGAPGLIPALPLRPPPAPPDTVPFPAPSHRAPKRPRAPTSVRRSKRRRTGTTRPNYASTTNVQFDYCNPNSTVYDFNSKDDYMYDPVDNG